MQGDKNIGITNIYFYIVIHIFRTQRQKCTKIVRLLSECLINILTKFRNNQIKLKPA